MYFTPEYVDQGKDPDCLKVALPDRPEVFGNTRRLASSASPLLDLVDPMPGA